jgi:hypothetical protein
MKVPRLACAPPWHEEPHGPTRIWRAPPGLAIVLSGIEPLPDDPVTWIRRELAEAGANVIIEAAREVVLRSGWPAFLVEARVERAATVDKRLVVMARFFEWAAVAMWRAAAPLYDAERDRVLEVVTDLDIDWGDPPLMTLAQVWDGLD